jgi:hypothetical protein
MTGPEDERLSEEELLSQMVYVRLSVCRLGGVDD